MLNLLEGIKVVDFTTIVLGPYASQFLGDFGADVVKVEPLEGDGFRAVRPGPSADIGAGFANFNRNKRSISIDLKHSAGKDVVTRLVADADVVIHNMRAMSALELGITYEQLKLIRPDLVYCWSPGFGSDGPDANSPAYDDVIQARSGIAALNADKEGAPQFVPSILCDKVVGLHLAMAVAAALVRRERTGEGQSIEVPMLETMASFNLAEHLAGQTMSPPQGDLGYQRLLSSNRRPYATADGYMAIMPYSTKQWIKFLLLVGETELADEGWVSDGAERSNRIDELYELIGRVAVSRTNEQWLIELSRVDVPCAVVNELSQVIADPQLATKGLLGTFDDGDLGVLHYLKPAFVADSSNEVEPRRPPHIGEHSREIMRELGMTNRDIQSLVDQRIVGDQRR